MNHIVALSGGKDSTAMALRLKEIYPNQKYLYICTPTGDELPEMEEHWDNLEDILGQPLIRLHDSKHETIYDLIEHFQALPNYHQRWCTRILKIEAAQQFYNLVKPAIIYVGLRADEPNRRGNKLFDEDVEQCFPMRNWGWGIDNVWGYLKDRGVTIPRRTDCAMCFYQRIGEWWMLWDEHRDIFMKLANLEDNMGHTLMTKGKHKIWPHALSDLAIEFENGRKPREIKNRKSGLGRIFECRVCSL